MTRANVAKQIGNNLKISLYDNRINLDVEKARRYLNYVPLKKHASFEYKKNNPLIAVIKNNKTLIYFDVLIEPFQFFLIFFQEIRIHK